MALGPTLSQANDLIGSLLRLIAKIRPEQAAEVFSLLTSLLETITKSRNPVRSLRLAALAAASKKASTLAIERLIGK